MKSKVLAAILALNSVATALADEPPAEFVTQVLEPTGGKIQRPQDWFYSEGHRGGVLMWTLSKEDTTNNRSYTTGVRIQAFVGVQEYTGKTPQQFVLDFVADKKKQAAKVIKTCDEVQQGPFTRVCLETEEGPHRILYSLFWTDENADLAVVSIAGTTQELWETYSAAFDRMSAFELINVEHFEPPAAADGKVVEVSSLRLYIPLPELEARIGQDVEPLSRYIKALGQRTNEILSAQERPPAKGLLIAVGIKSKTQTRVWCQAVDGELPEKTLRLLEQELTKVEAVDLKRSPAGFALDVHLFGQQPEEFPEFPDSWLKAAKESKRLVLIPPDALFEKIWPD